LQSDDDLSHIGGLPNLPADVPLPSCGLCGANMTFFFQVQFPAKHAWAGRVMAIFACTSCSDLDHGTPPMAPDLEHLPDGFLDGYEKNFKILAFESIATTQRTEYTSTHKDSRQNQRLS
jgi:hypothetical protein